MWTATSSTTSTASSQVRSNELRYITAKCLHAAPMLKCGLFPWLTLLKLQLGKLFCDVTGVYYHGTRITDLEPGQGIRIEGDVMRAIHQFRVEM